MIENLTASHLGDPDFLDLLCHQVVIQEVLVHNLLSWLAVVRDIVSQAEEGDKSHPALRTRVHIRVEEKVLQPLPELLLVAVILLFLLALLLRLFLLVGVILVLLLVLYDHVLRQIFRRTYVLSSQKPMALWSPCHPSSFCS